MRQWKPFTSENICNKLKHPFSLVIVIVKPNCSLRLKLEYTDVNIFNFRSQKYHMLFDNIYSQRIWFIVAEILLITVNKCRYSSVNSTENTRTHWSQPMCLKAFLCKRVRSVNMTSRMKAYDHMASEGSHETFWRCT